MYSMFCLSCIIFAVNGTLFFILSGGISGLLAAYLVRLLMSGSFEDDSLENEPKVSIPPKQVELESKGEHKAADPHRQGWMNKLKEAAAKRPKGIVLLTIFMSAIATPGVALLIYFAVYGALIFATFGTLFSPIFTADIVASVTFFLFILGPLLLLLPTMAYGLWKMRNWAAYLTMLVFGLIVIVCIIMIAVGSVSVSVPVGIISASIMIYLARLSASGAFHKKAEISKTAAKSDPA